MTGSDLWKWRVLRRSWTQDRAARAIGITRVTYAKHETRDKRVPLYIERSVRDIEAELQATGESK